MRPASRAPPLRHSWFGILRQALTPPRKSSALPPHGLRGASPKAVSGRTSYLRVRLEFLRYPHLIPALFSGRGSGPPAPFTAPSAWAWVGHPVSGLRRLTCAHFRLGFPAAPRLLALSLASRRSSPDRSTKSTRAHTCGATAACGHGVSGSLSLPSRGAFHLSLTVLCAIGRWGYFALRGGPRLFRRGSPCPGVLWVPLRRARSGYGALALSGRLFQSRSPPLRAHLCGPKPRSACTAV